MYPLIRQDTSHSYGRRGTPTEGSVAGSCCGCMKVGVRPLHWYTELVGVDYCSLPSAVAVQHGGTQPRDHPAACFGTKQHCQLSSGIKLRWASKYVCRELGERAGAVCLGFRFRFRTECLSKGPCHVETQFTLPRANVSLRSFSTSIVGDVHTTCQASLPAYWELRQGMFPFLARSGWLHDGPPQAYARSHSFGRVRGSARKDLIRVTPSKSDPSLRSIAQFRQRLLGRRSLYANLSV